MLLSLRRLNRKNCISFAAAGGAPNAVKKSEDYGQDTTLRKRNGSTNYFCALPSKNDTPLERLLDIIAITLVVNGPSFVLDNILVEDSGRFRR